MNYLIHICLQKTASQWIKSILSDPKLLNHTRKEFYYPNLDYISSKENFNNGISFPFNSIISPLYINYNDFQSLDLSNYKAFVVVRDIRDVMISQYFSIAYSHNIINANHKRTRDHLQSLPKEQSIEYFFEHIYKVFDDQFSYRVFLNSWMGCNDQNIKIYRYEDLTQYNKLESWKKLFDFLNINLNPASILSKYEFKDKGKNKITEHLRNGLARDFENHFSESLIKKFNASYSSILSYYNYDL